MAKSKEILNKIKEENIKPIPKWYFLGRNLLIWTAFGLTVLIGAIAFSIILFAIQQTDFNLISHLSHSKLELFLGLLPFFWIITLIIFLIMGIYSLQRSPRGYKLRWPKMAGVHVSLSILVGTLFFLAGGAGKLEKAFAVRMALYESIEEKKVKIWMMPEEGFLSGTIESVSDSIFQLIDFDEDKWQIDYSNAFIPPVVLLEKGEKIKLIGAQTNAGTFTAEEIRPWGGPQQRMRRQGSMPQN